jgi:hypothetical protein
VGPVFAPLPDVPNLAVTGEGQFITKPLKHKTQEGNV